MLTTDNALRDEQLSIVNTMLGYGDWNQYSSARSFDLKTSPWWCVLQLRVDKVSLNVIFYYSSES